MNLQSRKQLFENVDIYPVTCESLSSGRSNLEVLKGVILGGAKIIQLRDKESCPRRLYEMAVEFRKITSRSGALLIINDHVDIALAADADGVHLGQSDLPLIAARRIAPQLLLGISTHSMDQALDAQRDGADYVNIGPIFPTSTKDGVLRVLGLEAISTIGPALKIPFTVMGGINETNLKQVLHHGARRVAMVTAITKARDIAGSVRSIREQIHRI